MHPPSMEHITITQLIVAPHLQLSKPLLDFHILYTKMAAELRRIVPEWSVSLPTWGVFVLWGGSYPGLTVQDISDCLVTTVSWVTLSLGGHVLTALEGALVHHRATSTQVHAVIDSFWKMVLQLSRASHPP